MVFETCKLQAKGILISFVNKGCLLLRFTVISEISNGFLTANEKAALFLIHLSLACILCDIGKQNSPRRDAAERGVPSGAILFA